MVSWPRLSIAIIVVLSSPLAHAAGFPGNTLVDEIDRERHLASQCAMDIKTFGDEPAIGMAKKLYQAARQELDVVTEALLAVVTASEPEITLGELQAALKRGVEKREALCDLASRQAPNTKGQRGGLYDLTVDTLGTVLDAATGLFTKAGDEELLARKTLETDLNASSWSSFDDVVANADAAARDPDDVAKDAKDFTTVDVFFGTNRKNKGTMETPTFDADRTTDVTFGKVKVTVPDGHHFARVERPMSLIGIDLDDGGNPKKYFTVQATKLLDRTGFMAEIRAKIEDADANRFEKQAFVFIHGFNVTFDEAAYRAAQITYDLGFDGAPIFYSWPSAGDTKKYVQDLDSALLARPHLQAFLQLLKAESGAELIHLIAHSMGTRVLMEVLTDIRQANPDQQGPLFHEIILASPDISRDDFVRMADQVQGMARGMTLYASANDLPLGASEFIAGMPRAGDVPEDLGPVVHDALDTIDATALGTKYFGYNHGEYADQPVLLRDIGLLMKEGTRPPDVRSFGLKKIEHGSGHYWQYPRQSSFVEIR